jgi:hypothetical protein
MENIEKLEVLVSEARLEATKFYEKGNKTAGTRLRAKMAEITVLCKSVRADVSTIKNAV